MAERKITGAVGLNGRVYREGDEDALAAAAEEEGVDLSRASDPLEGDWGGANTVNATDGAKELAEEEGIALADVDGSGKDGRVKKSDVKDALEG